MTDQQFCLRWNNHQSTLVAVFDGLLEKGVLVDCTLAAEGQQLTAHKVVLAACSPFLETLLSRHYDKHPILILKDVKFSELKAMMDYMYRGEVNISQDQLGTFLKAAESLQIKGLSDGGGNEKDTHSTKRHHERKPLRPTSPLRNSMPPVPPVVDAKRPPPPFLHNSIRNSLKSSPLLVDIPEDSLTNRGRDGSISPIPRKKKRPREPEELNPLNNNVLCKTELNIDENPVTGARPSPEEPARVPSPDADRIKADSALDKTDPSAHLKHELIEEEEDINEDSVELTLDEDEMGEAGPSHNEGDYSNDFYGGTQDGDNRDGQEFIPGWTSNLQSLLADSPYYVLPALPKLTKIKKEYKGKKGGGGGAGSKEHRDVMMMMANSPAGASQEKFICTTCERVYKNKDSLGRHLKWECGKEPSFACSRCPYKARYKADLLRHEKTRHLKREVADCSLLCATSVLDA